MAGLAVHGLSINDLEPMNSYELFMGLFYSGGDNTNDWD